MYMNKYQYHWVNTQTRQTRVTTPIIARAIRNARLKHGVKFRESHLLPNAKAVTRNAYILVGPLLIHPNKNNDLYTKLGNLALRGAKVNVFPVIPSPRKILKDYKRGAFVCAVDKQLKINHIFPDDVHDGGFLTPSTLDVLSNIECETFHNKTKVQYKNSPENISKLKTIRAKYKETIEKISLIIRKYQLYDRAPTDGALIINENPQHTLASARRTNKTTLSSNDMVLIHTPITSSNSLSQTGKRRHTSDVELIPLSQSFGKRFLIHLHTPNKLVSRGVMYPQLSTQKEYPYGELQYWKEIHSEAKQIFKNTNQTEVFNLKNHGLVFSVNSPEELEKIILKHIEITKRA